MLKVMFIDRSNPVIVEWIRNLARASTDLPIKIVFVSDKEKSEDSGNLEIVNVHDVPQTLDIGTIERRLGFSVHRALVPERSFFDYSSFRRCQTYSDMSLEEIGRRVQPYLNAFDYLIREKVDVVAEGLMDNFMTSLAGNVARAYGKPFFMGYAYYWWSDGIFFIDRLDQTSSQIDELYCRYRARPHEVDRQRMDRVFEQKRATFQFPGGGVYPLKMRLQQLAARRHSYEPISWRHWACRRFSVVASRLAIRFLLKQYRSVLDEDFVLFPLHVSPEATLLGSAPEMADQFGLIKNISMHLPFGVRLYVKQHPAQQMGHGLDYGFYRRLASLPNVRYFAADAPLRDLMLHPRCRGVAVINGTVGLEAAMLRVPVYVFGRALYGEADCFYKPKDFFEFYAQVQHVCDGKFRFDVDALYAILQALDDAVVRADIEMTDYKSWAELALSSYPIHRSFFRRCLAQTRQAAEEGRAS